MINVVFQEGMQRYLNVTLVRYKKITKIEGITIKKIHTAAVFVDFYFICYVVLTGILFYFSGNEGFTWFAW